MLTKKCECTRPCKEIFLFGLLYTPCGRQHQAEQWMWDRGEKAAGGVWIANPCVNAGNVLSVRCWTDTAAAAAADGCCLELWRNRAQVCAPKHTLNIHGRRGIVGWKRQERTDFRWWPCPKVASLCRSRQQNFTDNISLGLGQGRSLKKQTSSPIVLIFFIVWEDFDWPASLLHT